MAQIKKISKMKFGIIDETYMNNIVDGVNEFNSIKDSLLTLIGQSAKIKSKPFLASLTSKADMVSIDIERFSGISQSVVVAWYYEFQSVQISSASTSSVDFALSDSSFTSGDIATSIGVEGSGYCFNMAELANAETYDSEGIVFGVNVSGEGYPPDFTPRGIPVLSKVLLTRAVSQSGAVIYVFDRQGTHDGICEEEP